MSNFHVSFSYKGQKYDFDLVSKQKSETSIIINGISYAILTDQKQIPAVKEILQGLQSLQSEEDLEGRIKSLESASNVSVTTIGKGVFGAPSSWKEKEEASLPRKTELLAEAYWNKNKDMVPAGLKGFLGPDHADAFDKAMKADDSKELAEILKQCKLSSHEIFDIYQNEELPYPLSYPKNSPYEITLEDLNNLQQYLNAIQFSGVVRISDNKATYTISAKGQEKLENAVYPIHSVGKVFTGATALMAMPEESYDQPLELDLEHVPKPIQEHIKTNKPTLHQAMTHQAGFGDYLENYEAAIKNGPLPEVKRPEDFLKFADNKFYPLNEEHYSNMGILLVALAVQHKTGEPFDKLQQEKLLNVANITLSKTKPSNARYNREDPCDGQIAGGPAGGYWASPEELHKLGTFLKQKCLEDPNFLSKMERFGQEFYVIEDREIRHSGNSSSGSSIISSFLDSGITITILSDRSHFMADKLYHTIRENLINAP